MQFLLILLLSRFGSQQDQCNDLRVIFRHEPVREFAGRERCSAVVAGRGRCRGVDFRYPLGGGGGACVGCPDDWSWTREITSDVGGRARLQNSRLGEPQRSPECPGAHVGEEAGHTTQEGEERWSGIV